MNAILFNEGKKVNIYFLQDDKGYVEVKDFFEKNRNNANYKGIIGGFMNLINEIASNGVFISNINFFDSWMEGEHLFCELKKGRDRISCFKYDDGKKLLLATHFIKTKQIEKKEYKRAIELKEKFEEELNEEKIRWNK